MYNENELFSLCKRYSLRMHEGKLVACTPVSPEDKALISAHKPELIQALSGYCFDYQVRHFDAPKRWSVVKASAIAIVEYQPVTVFSGTAAEVDQWSKDNKDDPLFTDAYTSRYSIVWDN